MALVIHPIRNCSDKIVFNGTLSITDATELVKKLLRGYHFRGLNSLNFVLVPSGSAPMKRSSVVTVTI